jgi:hypothetical protein
MSQPPSDADRLVDLLVRRALDLRRAGVLEVTIGDMKASLAPFQEEPIARKTEEDEMPIDPLNDPHTYGLPKGSKLPGVRHLEVIDDVQHGKQAKR